LREVLKDVKRNIIYFENDISAISGNLIYSNNIMEKKCCKCKLSLEITNFGKLKSSPDGLRYDCNICRKKYREQNKKQIQEKQKSYYKTNKDILLEKNKQYRLDNNEKINSQRKEYRNREEIKEHIKQKNKEYLPIKKEKIKEKRKNNLNFQVSEIIRSKVHKMLKGINTSYQELIGCDIEHLKRWIEYRFDEQMTWDNLGKYWHIDHILPINKFNFTNKNEQQICFHWTNLQPLNAKENIQKTDKLLLHHYFNNIVNVNRFNSKYNKYLGYQTLNESLKWLRCELRYGKNSPYDKETLVPFEIDNPQPSSCNHYDKIMEKVQRLNGFGSEETNHLL